MQIGQHLRPYRLRQVPSVVISVPRLVGVGVASRPGNIPVAIAVAGRSGVRPRAVGRDPFSRDVVDEERLMIGDAGRVPRRNPGGNGGREQLAIGLPAVGSIVEPRPKDDDDRAGLQSSANGGDVRRHDRCFGGRGKGEVVDAHRDHDHVRVQGDDISGDDIAKLRICAGVLVARAGQAGVPAVIPAEPLTSDVREGLAVIGRARAGGNAVAGENRPNTVNGWRELDDIIGANVQIRQGEAGVAGFDLDMAHRPAARRGEVDEGVSARVYLRPIIGSIDAVDAHPEVKAGVESPVQLDLRRVGIERNRPTVRQVGIIGVAVEIAR